MVLKYCVALDPEAIVKGAQLNVAGPDMGEEKLVRVVALINHDEAGVIKALVSWVNEGENGRMWILAYEVLNHVVEISKRDPQPQTPYFAEAQGDGHPGYE